MEKYTNKKIDENTKDRYPIKLWLLFEVQAVKEDVALGAMKKHIESLNKEEGVLIEKYLIEDPGKIDAPDKLKINGISHVYSVIGETIIYVDELSTAFKIVMNYAPSSIEVLSPNEFKLTLRDLQDSLNNLADFMHKILSQGVGGVVLKM